MATERPDDKERVAFVFLVGDASGSFHTVVFETTLESLAEWERRIA